MVVLCLLNRQLALGAEATQSIEITVMCVGWDWQSEYVYEAEWMKECLSDWTHGECS